MTLEDDEESLADEEVVKAAACGGCCQISEESATAFKQMMDFSLLKDWVFIMFAVSNFLTSIGFNVPYIYTVVSIFGLKFRRQLS